MHRLYPAVFAVSCGLFAASLLTGCGDGFVSAATDVSSPITASMSQPIVGSVYGGHAPLVGAHVYLVQPGTTKYGDQVTSILTSSSTTIFCNLSFPCTGSYPNLMGGETFPLFTNGSFPNTTGADEFVPAGFKGVLSDAAGQFYITGDYTCTTGRPVIVIAYGGYPSYVGQGSGSTPSAQTNTFPISGYTVSNLSGSGAAETAAYTWTISGTTPELFYIGQNVTINGVGGLSAATGTATPTGPVLGTNLSTFTFAMTLPDVNGQIAAGTYTASATVTSQPPFNPAIANMAVLGNCPSSGNFSTGATAIQYLYMNEVSTAAAAYSFAGFTNTAATALTGYDEFHIGTPSVTQAQGAIFNAAITAGNLYDIQGSNVTTQFAGEGHIGRIVTPSGTGVAPQAAIDTIGNILAACVDSTNTYRTDTGVGTQSASCKVLGQYAQDNGVVDISVTTHQAANTAQAAFNMARFPQGNGTGSGGVQTVAPSAATAAAYVAALAGLPTGNVPFTPNIALPNDFSLPIHWSNVTACPQASTVRCGQSGFDIDASGNIWEATQFYGTVNTGAAMVMSPAGLFTVYTPPAGGSINNAAYAGTGAQPGLEMDPSGNAYVPGTVGVYKFVPGNLTGTQVNAAVGMTGGSMAADANNIYFGSNELNPLPALPTLIKETPSGTLAAGFPVTATAPPATTNGGDCLNVFGYLTVDALGNIWTDKVDQTGVTSNSVCEFDSTGHILYRFIPSAATNPIAPNFFFQPSQLSTDRLNNVFFSDGNNQFVGRITVGQGNATTPTQNVGYKIISNSTTSQTPAATEHFSKPTGVAIDGAHTVWVTNQVNDTVAHLDDSLTALSGTYYGFPFSYTDPRNGNSKAVTDEKFVAVDAGGNVWTGGSNDGQFQEFVGMGTPTVTPRSYARANGLIGAKPGLVSYQIVGYNIGNAGTNEVQFTTTGGTPSVNETLVLSGFPASSAFLNGQTVVVQVTGGFGNTVFQVMFTHATVSPNSDNGVASPLN